MITALVSEVAGAAIALYPNQSPVLMRVAGEKIHVHERGIEVSHLVTDWADVREYEFDTHEDIERFLLLVNRSNVALTLILSLLNGIENSQLAEKIFARVDELVQEPEIAQRSHLALLRMALFNLDLSRARSVARNLSDSSRVEASWFFEKVADDAVLFSIECTNWDKQADGRPEIVKNATNDDWCNSAIAAFQGITQRVPLHATGEAMEVVANHVEMLREHCLMRMKHDPAWAPSLNFLRAVRQAAIASMCLGEFAAASSLVTATAVKAEIRESSLDEQVSFELVRLYVLLSDYRAFEKDRDDAQSALREARRFAESNAEAARVVAWNQALLRAQNAQAIGRRRDAETMLAQLIAEIESAQVNELPLYCDALESLGIVLGTIGEGEASRGYLQQAHERRVDYLGEGHPDLCLGAANRAWVLASMQLLDDARLIINERIEKTPVWYQQHHPYFAILLYVFGRVHWATGYEAQAELDWDNATAICRSRLGPTHWLSVMTGNALVLCKMQQLAAVGGHLKPWH